MACGHLTAKCPITKPITKDKKGFHLINRNTKRWPHKECSHVTSRRPTFVNVNIWKAETYLHICLDLVFREIHQSCNSWLLFSSFSRWQCSHGNFVLCPDLSLAFVRGVLYRLSLFSSTVKNETTRVRKIMLHCIRWVRARLFFLLTRLFITW